MNAVDEKERLLTGLSSKNIIMGLQHTFVMFGATITTKIALYPHLPLPSYLSIYNPGPII
jgi:xanthine/uracil permease